MSPKLPAVTARRFIKALAADGFVKTRQSGSHAVFKRETDRRLVVVAIQSGSATIPLGTLKRMIKDAGWTDEDFIRFLSNT